MNDSVDRSLIVPDELKHLVSPLKQKTTRLKRILIVLGVLSVILLAIAVYLLATPVAPQDVVDQNKKLKQLNQGFRDKNNQLAQELTDKKEINSVLSEKKRILQSQLQQNKDLIVYLEKDIQLNCNSSRQRLRFNMTSMEAFTLSVQNTGGNEATPIITFLNLSSNRLSSFNENSLPDLEHLDISRNQITSFSGNSLSNVEYLDLTNNQITKISRNTLDKLTSIMGITSQLAIAQFSTNFLPVLKSLDLSSNNISVFRDNIMTQIESLNISHNKLSSFSNLPLGSLVSLDVSFNPITEFCNNNFQNLVEFSCILQATRSGDSILFQGSIFGKVKTLYLSSHSESYLTPGLTFSNNTFPLLDNLTLSNFGLIYQSLKSNRMPVLVHIKFESCSFLNGVQYLEQLRLLVSLEYFRSRFKNFTGHIYPNLVKLHLNQTDLSDFSNNTLPALEELFIINVNSVAIKSSICNNSMPNLKRVVFQFPTDSDYSCLSTFRSLEYLELRGFTIDFFDGYTLPSLTTLIFDDIQLKSINSHLPSLTHLKIFSRSSSNVDLSQFQGQLEKLELFGSFEKIGKYFPKLKYLQIGSGITHMVFNGYSLPLIEQLRLDGMDWEDSNNLPSVKRLQITHSNITFSNKYDEQLEILLFVWNKLSFDSHKMPNLKILYVSACNLTTFNNNLLPQLNNIKLANNKLARFECSGMVLVEILDLSNNLLTENVVDTLISCKFTHLVKLDLSGNKIVNKDDAKKRLSQAYSQATVLL